jgi:hypothetical protein
MSAAVLAAGVLFGFGLRIAEWLVPAPDTRVVVCAPSEDDDDSCVPLGLDEQQQSPDDEDSDAPNSIRV